MSVSSFDDPNVQMAMKLFMIRGAHGYKGFSEKIGDNMYKSNSIAFREAIENSTEPIDPSKVSSLSADQLNILNRTPGGKSLIPLLNRMGELGMMDFREGLINPKIVERFQKHTHTAAINAYRRSI